MMPMSLLLLVVVDFVAGAHFKPGKKEEEEDTSRQARGLELAGHFRWLLTEFCLVA